MISRAGNDVDDDGDVLIIICGGSEFVGKKLISHNPLTFMIRNFDSIRNSRPYDDFFQYIHIIFVSKHLLIIYLCIWVPYLYYLPIMSPAAFQRIRFRVQYIYTGYPHLIFKCYIVVCHRYNNKKRSSRVFNHKIISLFAFNKYIDTPTCF